MIGAEMMLITNHCRALFSDGPIVPYGLVARSC